MIELTNDNFQAEVIESDIPVLIDYFAKWCGPCKMMAPVFKKMSETYSEQLKFCTLDIEEVVVAGLPPDFAVTAIPALVLFKDGEIVSKNIGLKTEDAIETLIEEVI